MTTNKILLKKLEDFGIIYDRRIENIINLINLDIKYIDITDSNGQSVVFITPIYVFQFYRNKEVFNKILRFIIIHNNKSQYFVKYIKHFEDLNTIVWEKIKPIYDFGTLYIKSNIKKIRRDIEYALEYIHQIGFLHGDCTLDNIGKNNKGNYVLFDFDLISNIGEKDNTDFYKFEKSIKFLYIK